MRKFEGSRVTQFLNRSYRDQNWQVASVAQKRCSAKIWRNLSIFRKVMTAFVI